MLWLRKYWIVVLNMLRYFWLNNTGCDSSLAYAFSEKLEADVKSNVHLSDFPGLVQAERKSVGKYNIPFPLVAIDKKINEDYGDVSANVKINTWTAEIAYVLFCAAIKEMDDLPISEITEDKMLKWRDAINDALRLNFNVRFAKERLKKIAKAYFDQLPNGKMWKIIKRKISHYGFFPNRGISVMPSSSAL